jgi:UDPglucose--hexose-1-phosphate uridylyltransferase
MDNKLAERPHRRFNPLTGEWVLVSPHRTQRPWQGQQEDRSETKRPKYDDSCYLCPGSTRATGQENPDFKSTFVFTNDFSALLPDNQAIEVVDDPLFTAKPESGICKVICFSPRHDLSVPNMDLDDVASVVRTWADEYAKFRAMPDITYAQIFENKGQIMGCSNPHPHCQIWASSSLPYVVALEQAKQAEYLGEHGNPLLVDYVARELEKNERIIFENEHFVALVPYWAVWPFETMVLPKRHCPSIDQFTNDEVVAFADAYKTLTQIYDRVFDCEFPYTAGLHQSPTTNDDHSAWQLHMHFYPPLLRSATVKKFMVGYEMLATPQRDITAESAAETLRQARAQLAQKC